MRRTSAVAGLVGLTTAALLLTGCASVSTGRIERGTAVPRASVTTAALTTSQAGTARMSLRVTTLGTDPLALDIAGTVALDGTEADLTATLPAGTLGDGSSALGVHELLTGRTAYLQATGASMLLPVWVKVDLGAAPDGSTLGSIATSGGVEQLLESLRDVGPVTKVGRQEVGVVATTRYHAVIDPTSFLGALPTIPGVDIASGAKAVAVPVDLWVDDQQRLVRLETTVGAGDAGITATLDLGDFGAPLDVQAPAGALDLSGLLGG